MRIFVKNFINMEKRVTGLVACLLGATSIMLGATGSHLIKPFYEANPTILPTLLYSYEIAVMYQMYSALFLLGIAASPLKPRFKWILLGATLFGVIFFCGSLYINSFNIVNGWGLNLDSFRGLKPAPIGGLTLQFTWLLAGIFYFIQKQEK